MYISVNISIKDYNIPLNPSHFQSAPFSSISIFAHQSPSFCNCVIIVFIRFIDFIITLHHVLIVFLYSFHHSS